jgi:hypothetical protein
MDAEAVAAMPASFGSERDVIASVPIEAVVPGLDSGERREGVLKGG